MCYVNPCYFWPDTLLQKFIKPVFPTGFSCGASGAVQLYKYCFSLAAVVNFAVLNVFRAELITGLIEEFAFVRQFGTDAEA